MNNFEIIKLNNVEDNILIVMKTSEPPFDFLSEMEEALRNIQYLGYVTIDELLHSGNTEERFIQGFFNGNSFENGKFKDDVTMNEMIEFCVPHMAEAHPEITEEKARQMMKEFFPHLKRWKKD